MCIILIGKINKQQFGQALAENSDGFSVFSKETGLIKDPDNETVAKVIKNKYFAIWHFRIGTSGIIDKHDTTNIHPFDICGGKYLLYHNGIIGHGDGKRSDTHCLADTLMDATYSAAQNVVKNFAGVSNRFVIVNAEDVTDYKIFGNWVMGDNGVLMSHSMSTYSYNSYRRTTSYPSSDQEYDLNIWAKGSSTPTISDTAKASSYTRERTILRRWIAENIKHMYSENQDLIVTVNDVDEVIGHFHKDYKSLAKPNCKEFTQTVLNAFDNGNLTIEKYSIKPAKTQLAMMLDEDDPFNEEDM